MRRQCDCGISGTGSVDEITARALQALGQLAARTLLDALAGR